MDWEKLLSTYGPMAVGLWFLWKIHQDVVYKAIPKGFEQIRNAVLLANQCSEERFRTHYDRMVSIERAIERGGCRQRKPKSRPPAKRRTKIRRPKKPAK